MIHRLSRICICLAAMSLSSSAHSQKKVLPVPEVPGTKPGSAPTCLAFIFRICRIENDTAQMLEEYDRIQSKGVAERIKFTKEYLNKRNEFKAEVRKLSPVAFRKIRQYAILTMKPYPEAGSHFVVFCGWQRERCLLFDPNVSFSQCVLTTEEFLEQYQGTAVVVSINRTYRFKSDA